MIGNEYNLFYISYFNIFIYYKFYSLLNELCLVIKFLVYYNSLQVVVNMIFVHFKHFSKPPEMSILRSEISILNLGV